MGTQASLVFLGGPLQGKGSAMEVRWEKLREQKAPKNISPQLPEWNGQGLLWKAKWKMQNQENNKFKSSSFYTGTGPAQ